MSESVPSPSPTSQRAWWGDRGVRTKTLTAVGAAAVVAAGVGVLGISALGTSAATSQDLYSGNISGLTAVADMQNALDNTRIAARNAILTPADADSTKIIDTTIPGHAQEFHAAAEAYAESNPTPEKQALVDSAVASYDQYVDAARTKLGPLALDHDYAGWWAENQAEVAPLATAVDDSVSKVRALEDENAAADAAAAEAQYEQQRLVAVVTLLVGLSVALLIGFAVARGVARSVSRVQKVTEALAAGDLTTTSGLTTNDELGQMGRGLDRAVASLRQVMAGVVASADAVAASSEELSASSAQISASAEETSAQSGVVSTAAEEVSRSVQTVAAGAGRWVRRSGRSPRTPRRPARSPPAPSRQRRPPPPRSPSSVTPPRRSATWSR